MTKGQGSIYEVTFFVDENVVAEFDVWLEDRIRNSLRIAAISDCRVFAIPATVDEHAGRVCQYLIETVDAINEVIDGEAADIESDVASAFGDQVVLSGRLLREDLMHDVQHAESPNCLNCGTHLRGQYCGNCGQRSRSRLISLWELISDAFGDLFEIDSRFWQTLVPLVLRPGRLTHDYLQGRRARYMPPFRMYLVLSLVFFLVAFFDPRQELSLLFEPQPESAELGTAATDDLASADSEADVAEQHKQEIFDQLAREGIIVGNDTPVELTGDLGPFNVQFDSDDETATGCDIDQSDIDEMPDWLARRLTIDRLTRVCERTQLDDGRALLDNLRNNVPAALIVLLPLMAMVLKTLYPLSRRYYVEHLLFFVHFHAFFFLILTLQVIFARASALVRLPEVVTVLTLVATSIYIPMYLFVAMRKVYGQGRFVSFLKYIALTLAYATGFLATMLGALAIAAFSI